MNSNTQENFTNYFFCLEFIGPNFSAAVYIFCSITEIMQDRERVDLLLKNSQPEYRPRKLINVLC